MRDKVEQFFVEVVEGSRQGPAAAAGRAFFRILSWIYRIVVQARFLFYRLRIFKSRQATAWVISVGNITLGGTGKTPVVERVAALLHERGRKVAIVSRGYRRKTGPLLRRVKEKIAGAPTTRVVSDGERVLLPARVAGDEPYMLAGNLEGIPVLINRKRYKAVQYAIKRFKADTIILDDGFQHIGVKRDLDIVLVDGGNPFGNGHIFPRGILREPRGNLARADLIMITKADEADLPRLRKQLEAINPSAELIECRHQPVFLRDVRTSIRASLDFIRESRVATLAGIARPDGFEKTIEKLGVEITRRYRFADHYFYRPQEIIDILGGAAASGAQLLITTEKDAARLPRLPRGGLPVYSLRVRIEGLEGEPEFDRQLLDSLRQRDRQRRRQPG
ncbi:MAG TPA: tetraacyldisaccharide 4'-kinase [bacterium]|nr:tetraacyldisaccharide 4'-kinase [bacterium]HPJ71112.1 tetraacyldisaccharide 4'-kinase [bacterium]